MKISQYSIDMASQTNYLRAEKRQMREIVQPNRIDRPDVSNSAVMTANAPKTTPGHHTDLLQNLPQKYMISNGCNSTDCSATDDSLAYDNKLYMTRLILEAITGKKIKIDTPDLSEDETQTLEAPVPENPQSEELPPPDLNIAVEVKQTVVEQETTTVSGKGTIQTQDGQQIRFSMQLAMHNEFYQNNTLVMTPGQAKDPLVLSLDGKPADLSEDTFLFDLNNDGQAENIHALAPGKGFLALDQNQNGVIDNGSELFGPQGGNGFLELKQYDEDQNNWIDENDSVFSKLSIWTNPQESNSQPYSLTEAGIGAIYLDPIDSQFHIKSDINHTKGVIQSTSLFVTEDGMVNPISQVDLVV